VDQPVAFVLAEIRDLIGRLARALRGEVDPYGAYGND
jgi:hypothetical protein